MMPSIQNAACNSCGSPNIPSVETGDYYPEWEYEVIEVGEHPENLKGTLNDLGKQGWSLVATTPALIFKRPRKPEEKPKGPVGFSVG